MIWTNMMTGWEKAFCSFYLLSISYAAVQRRCRRWSYLNSWFSCRGTQKQIEWLGMKREYFVGILQSTSEFVLSQRIWISFLRNLILNFYSWPNLVVPYTEELISRPFVGENWFRLMLLNRMSAKNAIGYFFLHSHLLLFHLPQSPTVSSAQWVLSNGFVPKRPIWISHQYKFAFLL